MNEELGMTLDEAVAEVLGLLTGLDLAYIPELDKYQGVTRQINAAMRAVALEQEWSYFSSVEKTSPPSPGQTSIQLRSSVRPRITKEDAVRIVDPATQNVVAWAYYQPREALHKYRNLQGLWASSTKNRVDFSRPFNESESRLEVHIPVMREPQMFRLPAQPENPNDPTVQVPAEVRNQYVDFDYPDLVIRKAAYLYAQTNPLWQPRVQTLEAAYKDVMYALQERDLRNTDTPFQNEWNLGIEGSAVGSYRSSHTPLADWQDRLF